MQFSRTQPKDTAQRSSCPVTHKSERISPNWLGMSHFFITSQRRISQPSLLPPCQALKPAVIHALMPLAVPQEETLHSYNTPSKTLGKDISDFSQHMLTFLHITLRAQLQGISLSLRLDTANRVNPAEIPVQINSLEPGRAFS